MTLGAAALAGGRRVAATTVFFRAALNAFVGFLGFFGFFGFFAFFAFFARVMDSREGWNRAKVRPDRRVGKAACTGPGNALPRLALRLRARLPRA